jgi:hypothetical protein
LRKTGSGDVPNSGIRTVGSGGPPSVATYRSWRVVSGSDGLSGAVNEQRREHRRRAALLRRVGIDTPPPVADHRALENDSLSIT